jgi:hypothetical protein
MRDRSRPRLRSRTITLGAVSKRQAVAHHDQRMPAVARARGRKGSQVQEGERRGNEACALRVELPRDRRLGGSRVSSGRNCGNGNDSCTAFPSAWHES